MGKWKFVSKIEPPSCSAPASSSDPAPEDSAMSRARRGLVVTTTRSPPFNSPIKERPGECAEAIRKCLGITGVERYTYVAHGPDASGAFVNGRWTGQHALELTNEENVRQAIKDLQEKQVVGNYAYSFAVRRPREDDLKLFERGGERKRRARERESERREPERREHERGNQLHHLQLHLERQRWEEEQELAEGEGDSMQKKRKSS